MPGEPSIASSIRSADEALPLARAVADADAERLIDTEPISCAAGCSACCVQAVPVRPAEVRAIRDHIDTLGAEEHDAFEQRIGAVVERLRRAGVTEPPDDPVERRAMVERYFNAGVACPFLTEDGTCGIRAVRPLVCREYLVTSDPVHCGTYRGAVVRIRSRRDVLAGFGKTSRALGESDVGWLSFSMAAEPTAPPARPAVSGVQVAQVLTAQRLPADH